MGLLAEFVSEFKKSGKCRHRQKACKERARVGLHGMDCRTYLHGRYAVSSNKLGAGATSTVFAGVDTLTGAEVAVKQIFEPLYNRHVMKCFMREIYIMRHLQHPNILSLQDVQVDGRQRPPDSIFLIMDKLSTNLRVALPRGMVASHLHVKFFFFQILHALKYIHKSGIEHRDVTPSNIFFSSDGTVKICDFGLSCGLAECESNLSFNVVTRYYRAPELLLQSTHYDESIDIWAAGCTFAEMLTGDVFFKGEDAI